MCVGVKNKMEKKKFKRLDKSIKELDELGMLGKIEAYLIRKDLRKLYRGSPTA